MTCIICDLINEKKETIYQDDKVVVLLVSKAFTLGHIKVVPKNHISIFEQVPDEILSYMITVANKFATILFDTLGLHGTNILIQNGVGAGQTIPHFTIDVIPRKSGDNLNLKWDMNKASHESLEGMKAILIDALESGPTKEVIKEEIKQEKISGDCSYLVKHLKHIP